MLPILLALVAALAYGISDFIAGLASRRLPPTIVTLVATAGALAIALVGALVVAVEQVTPEALAWGAASGLGTAFGGVMLYRGLARGRMAVVAPVSAIGAAVLPILVGVVLGERPSALAWAGVALALPAIWLVTRPADDHADSPPTEAPPSRWFESDLVDGLLAGAGFALLFIGLDRAGESAGLWPVVAGELAAIAALGIASIGVLRAAPAIAWRSEGRTVSTSVVAGLLGGLASSAYFLATHDGLLSIVAVVASLYPAVTVVLAALVLREPIGRWQLVGLAAAVLAVAAIVAG